MAKQPEGGEVYRGPCGIFKDTAWLTAESIPGDGKDTPVQIEAVVRHKTLEFNRPGSKTVEKKTNYGALKFVGKDKMLGLNATNLRILAALFGTDTSGWFGQWIALYVDPHVSAFGQIVSAVRIRAKKIDAPKAGKVAPPSSDEMFADRDAE